MTHSKQADTNVLSRGLFVVFEGLDGTGTTTQARLLHEALLRDGHTVYMTSEPTQGPVGNLIRLAMSHRLSFSDETRVEDRQLAYLFAADRHDHLFNQVNGVLPLLKQGAVVISTRYYLSSYAYHCNSSQDIALVRRLNEDFPPADLTLFLECPIDVCLSRIARSRSSNEKYETPEKLAIVSKYYELALAEYRAPLKRIDGTRGTEAVHEEVYSSVSEQIQHVTITG